jgi:chromosome partitioning protein
MVYTVGGIKGGSGKTTIATNFIVWLSKKGNDVLLIDADGQETATDFTAWRENTLGDAGYTSVKLSGDNVRTQVKNLKTKYDHIVIDTGGRDTTSQRAALFASDVLLLPFNPRSFDIWTVTKVQKLLAEIAAVRPAPLKTYAFLNRADVRGSDNADAGDALKDLNSIEFIPVWIGNRKAFSNAAGRGLSVIELSPGDEKANKEIDLLFETIINK